MATASTYQCPNCGGALEYNVSTKKLTCAFCGNAYDEGELELEIPLDSGHEVKETEHVKTVDEFLKHAPWSEATENAIGYSCPSCGAEVVADQATVSTNCPYCGNNMIVSGIATSENVPQAVLPFSVTKQQAEEQMRNHFQHKWYLSRKFNASLEHMQSVYVPYHLYDMRVWGQGDYIGYHEETDDDGNSHKTGYKAIVRSGYENFERIPVDGSSKMPDAHMDAIGPFGFDKMRPFASSYVAGHLTEVADESVEACEPRAEKRARNSFESDLRADVRRVRGVDGIEETVREEVHVDQVRAISCVLPVWLMHCTWEEEEMLFAVNGETGKCVGNLPVAGKRRGFTIAGIILALLPICALLTFVVFKGDEHQMGVGVGSVFLSILVVFAIDSMFMGQMHTAVESKDASRSLTEEGLVLTEKWDSGRFHMRTGKARDKIAEYNRDAEARGGRWEPEDADDGTPGSAVEQAASEMAAEAEAPTVCPNCGFDVAPGTKFCIACGTPLQDVAMGAAAGAAAAGAAAATVAASAEDTPSVTQTTTRKSPGPRATPPEPEARPVEMDQPSVTIKESPKKGGSGCGCGCATAIIVLVLVAVLGGAVWYFFIRKAPTSRGSLSVDDATMTEVVTETGQGTGETTEGGTVEDAGQPIGWQEADGAWYYLDAYGEPLTGWQESDSGWYYFGENGAMSTGWTGVDGAWYNFGEDGVMLTAWQHIDGCWYYFWSDGKMATGLQTIDGASYFFMDHEGVPEWPLGSMVHDAWYEWEGTGQRSYFGSDGVMLRDTTIGQFYINADGYTETW